MFSLIWIIMLVSYVDADLPQLGTPWCYKDYCVTLSRSVTAETGLCAVIHCTFNVPQNFYLKSLAWYKCDGQQCPDSNIIFNSANTNVQSSFSGRVSLLEPNPDPYQRNCSIIINDLRLSDSGKYVLRINGYYSSERFTFIQNRATITVKALQQKPTVLSPALTEGQWAALTCIAPGLCSGSEPTFTWTWTGSGHAPPNVTTATTERLTAVGHRHRSTLKLRPSAELHGAELSCTVSFQNESSSTQAAVRLNVTYVRNIEVSGDTVVKEGDSLNVTCSVNSFPPSRLMWFGPNKEDLNERSNQTELGSASLLIHSVTQAQSGQYMCEGLHLSSSQTRDVNISVKYLREPVITGDTIVAEGSALNLTCTVDSFPPSNITLSRSGIHWNSTQTDSGSASLLINNVTSEDAGSYNCTVEHELRTVVTSVDVKVLLKPQILNSSECVHDGMVLSCSCVSRSSPVPEVTWPLLQHRSEYTLITTVTGDTVNSSLVLRESHHNTTVQCVSSNRAGQVHENFTPVIRTVTKDHPAKLEKIIEVVSSLEVIVAFFAGFILAVAVFCMVQQCYRKKQKSSDKEQDGNLELVNSETEAELNGHMTHTATDPEELHYASINFSAMARKGKRDGAKREETKTEYAEIKREVIERENEEVQKEEEERPGDTEEAAMMEDVTHNVPQEEEETALYSNMKEVMANE